MRKREQVIKALAKVEPGWAEASPKERAERIATAGRLLDDAVVEAFTSPAHHEHMARLMRRELRIRGGAGLLAETIRSTVAAR
jgi:hypothetical protein